jgi:hypothetical protein
MFYEFITPSDPITFKADDPKVAFYVGLSLGRGKAGVTAEDGTDIPCMLLFSTPEKTETTIKEQLGDDPKAWAEANREAIATCYESFAYGSFRARRDHEAALEAITDPEKLAAYKARHEDTHRTSMSKWVSYAWECAAAIRKNTSPAPENGPAN